MVAAVVFRAANRATAWVSGDELEDSGWKRSVIFEEGLRRIVANDTVAEVA